MLRITGNTGEDKWDFYGARINIIMKRALTQKSSPLSLLSPLSVVFSLGLAGRKRGRDAAVVGEYGTVASARILSREDKSVSERKIKLSDQ